MFMRCKYIHALPAKQIRAILIYGEYINRICGLYRSMRLLRGGISSYISKSELFPTQSAPMRYLFIFLVNSTCFLLVELYYSRSDFILMPIYHVKIISLLLFKNTICGSHMHASCFFDGNNILV